MLHTDSRFADAVETAVSQAEGRTAAEIVVVAAPRSGSYRDISAAAGAVTAWVTLIFLLFSPWSFSPVWIPIELPLVGLLVAWLVERSPRVLRLLSRHDRRARQVHAAAACEFHDEAVHCTRARTGLLVYVSALENQVVLLPDAGLQARVPGADWNRIRWGDGHDPMAPGDLRHFVAGLAAIGDVLAAHVPPDDDNPNEISDRPRIRP